MGGRGDGVRHLGRRPGPAVGPDAPVRASLARHARRRRRARGRRFDAPRAGRPGPPATGSGRPCSRCSAAWPPTGERLEEATVVDLFAGSGAFGIEALSRGRLACVFVDDDRPAVATIRDNLAGAGPGRGPGHGGPADALRWLRRPDRSTWSWPIRRTPSTSGRRSCRGWSRTRPTAGVAVLESGVALDLGGGVGSRPGEALRRYRCHRRPAGPLTLAGAADSRPER